MAFTPLPLEHEHVCQGKARGRLHMMGGAQKCMVHERPGTQQVPKQGKPRYHAHQGCGDHRELHRGLAQAGVP